MNFIDHASGNVFVAAPVLSSSSITAALCRAETRGCTVRAVLDVTSGTSSVRGGYALAHAGATVYAATFSNSIPHNFITSGSSLTMTGNYVWSNSAVQTGQYIQTIAGTATVLSSSATYTTLAASGTPFLSFSGSRPSSATATPQVWFSPNGGCESTCVSLIDSASNSVYVTAYDFTSRPIADALQRAKTRGIIVAIVQDKKAGDEIGSVSPLNIARGLDVYIDGQERIMHNKYMVFDGHQVLTGSYNWTNNAEHTNAENILVLDDVCTAESFLADWNRHARHSQRVNPPPPTPTERSYPPTQCPNGKCQAPRATPRQLLRPWKHLRN